MIMLRLKLSNTFHNTQVYLLARDMRISPRQARRAQRELCGVSGCTCSGDLGVRGGISGPDGTKYYLDCSTSRGGDLLYYNVLPIPPHL